MKVVFDDVSQEWIVRFSIDDISLNPKFQCLLPLVADFIISDYLSQIRRFIYNAKKQGTVPPASDDD